mgnify:CR=1 FL=1
MKHLLDILDLSTGEIERMMDLAEQMDAHPERYEDSMKHKTLATLFFEPSTRTRLSFESAMLSLGGNVLGFSDANTCSATKGESLSDTVTVVSGYVDILAMRHPKEGAPAVAIGHSSVPVINAGDGGHYHPTQTLADLLTIKREKGRLDNLTVGFCGDLRYGRTVHSLIGALSRYEGIRFVLISPQELSLPEFVKKSYLTEENYEESTSLEEKIGQLDVLYMTRVQKERFTDLEKYESLKDVYVLTEEKMREAKDDMIVLHPLPRVNEIEVAVDKDPRAAYWRQVKNGKYIRRERYAGSCSRSFYVGDQISQEDVKAKFENGILKLSIPKKEEKPAVEENKYISIEG